MRREKSFHLSFRRTPRAIRRQLVPRETVCRWVSCISERETIPRPTSCIWRILDLQDDRPALCVEGVGGRGSLICVACQPIQPEARLDRRQLVDWSRLPNRGN